MTIHFGNDFDGTVLNCQENAAAAAFFAGPNKLLQWLEAQLGLSGYNANSDYLRIELYRQSLSQSAGAFYAQSFEADRFATAEFLLGWRDELLLAGWNFDAAAEGLPTRLQTLAEVEALFRKKINDPELSAAALGFADRFEQVLQRLKHGGIPSLKLRLYEAENLQQPIIQRFLAFLRLFPEKYAIEFVSPGNAGLSKDVEVLILKCRRDSDAATFLAQTLRDNPGLNPVFLAPQPSLALEQSLLSEGFAAMGIQSASLARPSLQVLKLAPAFLWDPVDVFKVMEFLTLPLKPLDAGLALEIARVMAEKPGFFSDTWFAAIYGYLENTDIPEAARGQYEFWFDRRRYPADQTAPKRDAVVLYAYLQEWARVYYEESGSNNSSLLVLAEQARRIHELLETLPEQRIAYLELERIVRTIFEASPIQLAPTEKGSFRFVHAPGAISTPVDTLIWWDFLAKNETPPPDKWQKAERVWLETQGIVLRSPRLQSQLNQLLAQRPFQYCTRRLLLVVPDQAEGAEALPSLLMSDLEVAMGEKFQDCIYCIDLEPDRLRLAHILKMPAQTSLPVLSGQRTRPLLQIAKPEQVRSAEYETPTNLESLFYYPHRWFFRQKLKLFPSSLLSVTGDNTLLGSLAHRFFETLLEQDLSGLDKKAVYEWVEEQALSLLPKEGATLLLYGREPERKAFLNRVKNAAWSLVSLLRSNGWAVEQTEMKLEGYFGDTPIRGKADLVLSRGEERAIIDLKWSGAKRRKELIMNGEDLQLVLYAKLLPPVEEWPHTAYFILEEGKIIARNAMAFSESVVAGRSNDDHISACTAIFEKMERTHQWRLAQINKGMIELRTSRTAAELEALYEGQLFDLLEMKNEDARWDDYRILVDGGR
jgi:PD-(D/E)XK nuclease superfamily